MKQSSVLPALMLASAAGAADLPIANAQFEVLDPASVELGWLLFYDPILSGNRNVACATCHHPRFGTSDGVALSIGDGGIGLGPARHPDPENYPEARVPRNAPGLFNLGAREFTVMFHDGRLEADPTRANGMRTPLGDEMTAGFKNVLAAQAMFPVLSADEMAGHYSENKVSEAVRLGRLTHEGGAWDIIAQRVAAVPEYETRFDQVLGADYDLHFTDIANAIADFIAVEWRADNSPFDAYLRGEGSLNPSATAGMDLFYGTAGCSSCHSGQFQTDHAFHAVAMPQIGPGKAAGFETHSRDTGRMRVTGKTEDAFKFRTPSLRNLSVTGPYGHAGTYGSLVDVVRHHTDPVAHLAAYDIENARLLPLNHAQDRAIVDSPEEQAAIAKANELRPNVLNDVEIAQIMAFLISLEDRPSQAGHLGVPKSVPSALPVDR